MTTNKKLGLLLLPLVPLSALGIVELASRIDAPATTTLECRQPTAPIVAQPIPLTAPDA